VTLLWQVYAWSYTLRDVSGILSVLGAIAATGLVLLFWFVVVIVIPGVIAVYAAMLFPLTGQRRKRWAERHSRPRR
jgi:hypothetical protein